MAPWIIKFLIVAVASCGTLMVISHYSDIFHDILARLFAIIVLPFTEARQNVSNACASVIRFLKNQLSEFTGNASSILSYICGTIVISAFAIVITGAEVGNMIFTLDSMNFHIPEKYMFSSGEVLTAVSLIAINLFSFIAMFDAAAITNNISWVHTMTLLTRRIFLGFMIAISALLLVLHFGFGYYRAKSFEASEQVSAQQETLINQQIDEATSGNGDPSAMIQKLPQVNKDVELEKIMNKIRLFSISIITLLTCIGEALCINSIFQLMKLAVMAIILAGAFIPLAGIFLIVWLAEFVLTRLYDLAKVILDLFVRIGDDLQRIILQKNTERSDLAQDTERMTDVPLMDEPIPSNSQDEEILVSPVSFDPYNSNSFTGKGENL